MSVVVLHFALPHKTAEIAVKDGLKPSFDSKLKLSQAERFHKLLQEMTKASSKCWISFPQRQYAKAFCP